LDSEQFACKRSDCNIEMLTPVDGALAEIAAHTLDDLYLALSAGAGAHGSSAKSAQEDSPDQYRLLITDSRIQWRQQAKALIKQTFWLWL
jgi:hypothetical protein